MKYKTRIVDTLLTECLQRKGAVLIEGPKWCGKTTTAKHQARSVLDLGNTQILTQSQAMMAIDSHQLLVGDTPRLFDEWQTLPQLWDSIRSEVDSRGECGQFILTGSAVPVDVKSFVHSGTGRYARLKMRPMSLWESGDSDGQISIEDLFEQKQIEVLETENSLEQLSYLICRGGFPQAVVQNNRAALELAFDYVEDIVQADIHRTDDIRRSSATTERLMRSLARHQATSANYSILANDLKENEGASISTDTIASYINALNKIFVLEDMPAWNPNLRSKTAIRSSDTRYFIDPSLATASLGVSPNDLMADLQTMGLFFETLVARDLRIYADILKAKIYHYRDANGLECDAVMHRRDGNYGLIEVKLGGENNIAAGAVTLNKLAGMINTAKMKKPAFLMVIVGVGKYAYMRPDGVYVVPVNCLKP